MRQYIFFALLVIAGLLASCGKQVSTNQGYAIVTEGTLKVGDQVPPPMAEVVLSIEEPYNAIHYRIQSHSRPWLWHHVTLHACPCETKAPWCWHRGLLHLLTAQNALTALDRCPRPSLMHVPPRQPHDMNTILRACDELF